MKLDWNELAKGVDSVFEKTAAPLKKPLAVGTAMGAGALGGAGLAAGGSSLVGSAGTGLAGSLAQYLPALLPFLAGGKPKNQPQRPPVVHVHTGRRPTLLDSLPENQVGGFSSMNSGEPIKVGGDLVTDALTAAVRNRLANKAIDAVTLGPKAGDPLNPAGEDKKLEIISKYPEMAELLKKEENKAYLEKLLKE